MTVPPFREASFGPVDLESVRRDDGSVFLRSRVPLGPYPRALTERLTRWASEAPDRAFLARRDAGGRWRTVTYAGALARVRRIGQALIDRGLGPERPVVVLSENSVEHALLALASLHVGVPFAPVSPSYSLLSSDFGRLSAVVSQLTPGLVFASDGARYGRAIGHAIAADVEVVTAGPGPAGRPFTAFDDLESREATAAVDAAHEAIDPDGVAKILFTSGSTGAPKGVVNTHRMLCSNLQQIAQCFPCMVEEPLELVDWLPWHHTFGGNHNVGLVLWTGGTLHIDDGGPSPAGMVESARNLREIAPTIYFNVPRGFDQLLSCLRVDADLRRRFFSRLKLMFYAGAGLAQPIWDGLQRLALDTIGCRVAITSGLGCTESAPSALFAHWADTRSGLLGVPVPGLELKLAPMEGKLEARYRGPNVTPGYFRRPEATRSAFDDEGFYRTGDALRFVDPARPALGLLFDGRLADDFKLNTGTWVRVGALRTTLVEACAPLVADAVLTGLDRDCVGAILFPSMPDCRRAAGLPETSTAADIVAHPEVRLRLRAALETCAAAASGSSGRVLRALLTPVPPAVDAGEVTDKGSLNQRAVLARRAALVDALHAQSPGEHVIVLGRS